MLTPPTPFGHEFAGRIATIGAGVTGWEINDRAVAANSAPCGECYYCQHGQEELCEDLLFVNGAYAEFILLPERLVRKNLLPIPEGLDASHVASDFEPLACVVKGVQDLGVRAGETVAVIGSGVYRADGRPAGSPEWSSGYHRRAAAASDSDGDGGRGSRATAGQSLQSTGCPHLRAALRIAFSRPPAYRMCGKPLLRVCAAPGRLREPVRWMPGRNEGRLRHQSAALRRNSAVQQLPPHPLDHSPGAGFTATGQVQPALLFDGEEPLEAPSRSPRRDGRPSPDPQDGHPVHLIICLDKRSQVPTAAATTSHRSRSASDSSLRDISLPWRPNVSASVIHFTEPSHIP